MHGELNSIVTLGGLITARPTLCSKLTESPPPSVSSSFQLQPFRFLQWPWCWLQQPLLVCLWPDFNSHLSFVANCLERSLKVRSAGRISLSAEEDGLRKSASSRLALASLYDLANLGLLVCFLLLFILLKGHINWFLTSHGWGNEPFSRQNSPYK